MAKLYSIQDIPADLLSEVGGKARGLNVLKNAGFTVPEAFIVTDIHEEDSLDDAAERYEKMGYEAVSVRSSATLEDGNDYSAAGQFSTYLDVKGKDAVKQAIRDCVGSLHNGTAEHYQKTFLQTDGRECKMTTVVQRMVNARCAGVIFTQAPMMAGYSLVEVVPGIGENLVSGKMSAQQYRVRKNHISKMPKNPILSKEEAFRLADEGKKIEKLFGQPMDLEWAIDQDGSIQWLQARPITVEESVTMNELDCKLAACESVITTSNIGEVMPGAVSPLNLSTNMLALDWGVMETYRVLGCIKEPAAPFKYISSYYNHMFFNMTNMYEVCHSCYGTAKESLDISICGHVLEGYPDTDFKGAEGWQKLKNTIAFMKYVFGGEEAKKGMDDTIASLHFDLTQDMHSIYQQILDNFDSMKWAQYYHYRTSYYSGGQSNFLMMAVQKQFESKEDMLGAIAGCLTEMDEFESANVLRRMRELARLMVDDCPEVSEYDNQQLADYLQNRAGAKVREAYDAFMERHGHRGIREMEIRMPSWRMNIDSFCQSMHSVIASVGKEETVKTVQKHWTDYADQLVAGAPFWKRRMIRRFINNARKGVGYREYTKASVVYVLDQFKQAYAQLARLMAEAGMLPDADAIYFLQQEEVGKLLKGDQSLVKKALARRRLYPQQEALKFADTCLGIPQPLVAKKADPNATQLSGTPVSRGVATGVARVVRSEADAAQLQPGEIMVAACTDIGWTPYYDIIGGLVTEIGSALSHGIVVAREYALPSVVNVENAMEMVHTGDNITIDGNTGTIFVNKRAE